MHPPTIVVNLAYHWRLHRRLRQSQAYRPTRPTFVQGAILVASCMVAAFVAWASAVLLLAMAAR